MGKYWVSYVELLILFEIWLLRDRGPNKRPGRLLVVPPRPPLSPPASPTALLHSPPGIQIRVEYKVPSSLLRSLATLEGGLARFVPCGLEKLTSCGHELTVRPLESVLPGSNGPELSLLGNWEGSVTHVVDGVLKVWSCDTPPVCWVMGVIGSGLTGSSTVSLRVRPVLGKEGGCCAPKAS